MQLPQDHRPKDMASPDSNLLYWTLFFFFLIFIYLFWLHRVLVVTRGIFVAACELLVVACMQDLVPRPGIEPGPPALGARSLTHWTTREVPTLLDSKRALTLKHKAILSPHFQGSQEYSHLRALRAKIEIASKYFLLLKLPFLSTVSSLL